MAARLGVALKEARLARKMTQREVAAKTGVSQAWVSRMERGFGASGSIETWAAVAAAVGQQFVGFLEHAPGADRPRDYEHLKRQQLVIATAASGGWEGLVEELVDPASTRSRAVDVVLLRRATREAAVVEIWDFFDDFGAAVRSLDGKVAAMTGHLNLGRDLRVLPWTVQGLWIARGTRRNRALVAEFSLLFASRFPALSTEWMAALTSPGRQMPRSAGLLWSDVNGTRLMVARLRKSASRR